MKLLEFKKILPSTFTYYLILIEMYMNANILIHEEANFHFICDLKSFLKVTKGNFYI